MSGPRVSRIWVTPAALLLLPTLALAEVSVQLDARGNFKRTWYLTFGKGSNAIVWKQVRPRLPLHLLLNPLGDNLGDGAPVIQVSPATGRPLAVWPKNFGNIRQLADSSWEGARWTEVTPIAPGAPLVYEDKDPALAFDQSGIAYLVWSRVENGKTRIYFGAKLRGVWSPAMQISDEGVEGRSPSIVVQGSAASITYQTPAGPVTKSFEAAVLVTSAASLMDNPVPPLYGPPPGGEPPPGGGGGAPGYQK